MLFGRALVSVCLQVEQTACPAATQVAGATWESSLHSSTWWVRSLMGQPDRNQLCGSCGLLSLAQPYA